MPFQRKIMPAFVMLLMIAGIVVACTTTPSSTPNQSNLLKPEAIAQQVATYYGESHAKITYVRSDQTDNPPHDPMYLMTLTGHFSKGKLVASTLNFSALANKMYVWNIYAYDTAKHEIWLDHELKLR